VLLCRIRLPNVQQSIIIELVFVLKSETIKNMSTFLTTFFQILKIDSCYQFLFIYTLSFNMAKVNAKQSIEFFLSSDVHLKVKLKM
jgi:hypothetical protein